MDFDDDSDGPDILDEPSDKYLIVGASVFLVDVGDAVGDMRSPAYDRLRTIMQVLYEVCLGKMKQGSQEESAIVLLGGVAPEAVHNFESGCVLFAMEAISAQRILKLYNIINDFEQWLSSMTSVALPSIYSAIWYSSLLLSIKLPIKITRKKVVLFTGRDQPVDCNDEISRKRLLTILHSSKKTDIGFVLIPGKAEFNIDAFYKCVLDECGFSFTDCLPVLLDQVQQSIACIRAIRRLPLYLTPSLPITVRLYSLIRPAKKHQLDVADFGRGANHDDDIHVTNPEESPSRIAGASSRKQDGPTSNPTDRSGQVRAWQIAEESASLTPAEEKKLKKFGWPGIHVIGFLSADRIPEYEHIRPSYFIYPDDHRIKGSKEVFSVLLATCVARSRAVLARLTLVTWPHLVYLVPQTEVTSPEGMQTQAAGFHVYFRPYCDDFRNLNVPSSVECRASSEQIEAAKGVIRKLRFKYSPGLIDNPDLEQSWATAQSLLLNHQQTEVMPDLTEMNAEAMDTKAGSMISTFKALTFSNADEFSTRSSKVPKIQIDADAIKEMANNRQVEKLTVEQLKTFLRSVGITIAKVKKQILVEGVYQYFSEC